MIAREQLQNHRLTGNFLRKTGFKPAGLFLRQNYCHDAVTIPARA